eukprot:CAMPEP_0181249376 /NCGR_PEP_ID=MMETSP1096-20121128/45719_1 /TAXON_ID=156174 ORGANISM="Chrysochromulina ericina, Strain CCMP281" /NCGR_SAMPLE_ID=MMETSP1096 /ASSEMBLY_ACC=CAM_ASM_000453 /LENGTH=231 /DNA_ID=CAMNT_0023346705 /DNA_START=167 /DNA_END=862 /DNA_ORIENTATION=-
MIFISTIIQMTYDTVLRSTSRCECAREMDDTKRPRLVRCLLKAQPFVGLLLFIGAVVATLPPIIGIIVSDVSKGSQNNWENTIRAAQTWGISSGIKLFGVLLLTLLLTTTYGRFRDRRNNFGPKREEYGWAEATDLPSHPPDMFLFCDCMPGGCASAMVFGLLMAILVGCVLASSLGTFSAVLFGGGIGLFFWVVGAIMTATSEDVTMLQVQVEMGGPAAEVNSTEVVQAV